MIPPEMVGPFILAVFGTGLILGASLYIIIQFFKRDKYDD